MSFPARIKYGVDFSGNLHSNLSSPPRIKYGVNSSGDPWMPAFAGMTVLAYFYSSATHAIVGRE